MTSSQDLLSLEKVIAALPGAVVAFSGGADSALVAEVAHRVLGPSCVAVTADSPSLPRRELTDATSMAKGRGWNHIVVQTDELSDQRYAANDRSRCSWCKSALMDRLEPIALEKAWPVLLGTNIDDLQDHRPGLATAVGRGALQPMVAAGLSKERVRKLSAELGLPTFDKPAAACLASRFAYGVRVTAESLSRVERAEEAILSLGYKVLRVRDVGNGEATVEVGADELARAMTQSAKLREVVTAAGFVSAEIDPRGYRQGSMNMRPTLIQVEKK